jgi:hypothetical protein
VKGAPPSLSFIHSSIYVTTPDGLLEKLIAYTLDSCHVPDLKYCTQGYVRNMKSKLYFPPSFVSCKFEAHKSIVCYFLNKEVL